jgi:hypothetical protein
VVVVVVVLVVVVVVVVVVLVVVAQQGRSSKDIKGSEGDSYEVDGDGPFGQVLVVLPDPVRCCGDVMACVALAEREKLGLGVLWVALQKLLQEIVPGGVCICKRFKPHALLSLAESFPIALDT